MVNPADLRGSSVLPLCAPFPSWDRHLYTCLFSPKVPSQLPSLAPGDVVVVVVVNYCRPLVLDICTGVPRALPEAELGLWGH